MQLNYVTILIILNKSCVRDYRVHTFGIFFHLNIALCIVSSNQIHQKCLHLVLPNIYHVKFAFKYKIKISWDGTCSRFILLQTILRAISKILRYPARISYNILYIFLSIAIW